MAKDRKKVLHIHSSVEDRQPTPASLEVGELAVNNNAGHEFISTKNTGNKVVRFSSDEQIINWMEKKEVFPYAGSVDKINLTGNTSLVKIKLNQVLANNTAKSGDVNHAKFPGTQEEINPSTDGGLTNGAGFIIDMSPYALTGGNPTFSSVTVNTVLNVSGDTNIGGDTHISGDTIIDGSVIISGTGLNTKLSWEYGNVCNNTIAVNDETNFKENKKIIIPNSVRHLKRETLSWNYGDVRDKSGAAYDPGKNQTSECTESTSFTIPKAIDDLTNWNGTCIELPHNVCVQGTITSTLGMYTSSDVNIKDDIQFIRGEEISRANRVRIKSFRYKNDPTMRKTYGVIAQEVEALGLEELVHRDEHGIRSVDYTGLLLLKIAALEKEIDMLKYKLENK